MARRLITAVAALALTVPLAGLPAGAAPPDGKGPGERPDTSSRSVQWYLALGDSLAAGYQPDRGDDLDGGYAGVVLDGLQEDYAKTKLVNLACSGETSAEMIEGGDCSYDQGSQLAAAEQFLRAHKDKVSTVTITIGANDVRRCLTTSQTVEALQLCALAEIQTVGANLDEILDVLEDAADPGTEMVVSNYYNPYLAAWLTGTDGQELAVQTNTLTGFLNQRIAVSAQSSEATELADVAGAFQIDAWQSVPFIGGPAPLNVVTICEWTWMCVPGRTPDFHANDDGYAAMGGAFLAALALSAE